MHAVFETDRAGLSQTPTRAAVAAAAGLAERECLPALIASARLSQDARERVHTLAAMLAAEVRHARRRAGGVDALMQEFPLGSTEGIALMCLAEAFLRIPDRASRDRLIRDKLRARDWARHVGHSPSLFVNAAAWSLALTGRLISPPESHRLPHLIADLVLRSGGVLVRRGVDFAMRLVGHQFVLGRDIEEALHAAERDQQAGFRYSFDVLGEAAMTAADADAYTNAYTQAIHTIGHADRGRGVLDGNGVSIKLSALHPRYTWSQHGRLMEELLPRVIELCRIARSYTLGVSLDAEEAERLDLSLDIFDALVADDRLAGWNGLGFVVQAYQKRAPWVIDHLIALARTSGRRLMVRLVKGAYWDSEIKRAQQLGLSDYPVYTRKAHTDVAYLACARSLLAARDVVFPQFATHNAHTVAAVVEMGGRFRPGDYEFQCLHGMGETLYRTLLPPSVLGRPCRIYAPVGQHDTLLAYLVRRMIENGANTGFVHRIVDESIELETLLADPVEIATHFRGQPHPRIPRPAAIYPDRLNAAGFDLSDASVRAGFTAALADSRQRPLIAVPRIAARSGDLPPPQPVINPAHHKEIVGGWVSSRAEDVDVALSKAAAVASNWAAISGDERAAMLEHTAAAMEAEASPLVALLIREAGKTLSAAVAEVREAADFCRYYAARLRHEGSPGEPLGPVVAISPWNFPLAIFVGQIAAGLAAGNPVLAKPAEQTPLVADFALRLFHECGVPRAVLQGLPGLGESIGARLVADPRVRGVLFTGSTTVARQIAKVLAGRGGDIPLVAETGGQNAMIVDATALPEQVAADVLMSAFDSAGQRCSALRVLCLQEDIAPRVMDLLHGGMAELRVGPPDDFATDIGPVIDAEAHARLEEWVEGMRTRGFRVHRPAIVHGLEDAWFMAPAMIEIGSLDVLAGEVFGPVLHVLRYRTGELPALIKAINATGYGLTLGIHSRVDETVRYIVEHARVGNIYVNRNMIGAVVGVQPFGGEGLSGTGPKAGGPLMLHRLVRDGAAPLSQVARPRRPALDELAEWVAGGRSGCPQERLQELNETVAAYQAESLAGVRMRLNGPTGEENLLSFHPRGVLVGLVHDDFGRLHQLAAALATGNRLRLQRSLAAQTQFEHLPSSLADCVELADEWSGEPLDGVLADLPPGEMDALRRNLAALPGPILPLVEPAPRYDLTRLVVERALSVNTTASGGNAALMTLADC